jgi:chitin deacetylase
MIKSVKNLKVITIILILLILSCIGYFFFKISKSRDFQFFGEIISNIETDEKVVALTFDDAPTEYIEEVLRILSEKDIKATFYTIGQSIEKYPDQTKEIIEQGHELGNHTYSHQWLVLKSPSFVENEIETTNQLIRKAGYLGEITFRPPYGKKLFILPWYLQQNNIRTIMWDIEADSYYPGNSELIRKYTVEKTKPGSIILLHPFCEGKCRADREALQKIIDELIVKGYRFVTISELLEYIKN